jgi:hypothetical protein
MFVAGRRRGQGSRRRETPIEIPDNQTNQNTQMTNATVSDKKVSFWLSNIMTS